MRIRQLAGRFHQLEQRPGAQIFFANLNPGDPVRQISGDRVEQRLGAQCR